MVPFGSKFGSEVCGINSGWGKTLPQRALGWIYMTIPGVGHVRSSSEKNVELFRMRGRWVKWNPKGEVDPASC